MIRDHVGPGADVRLVSSPSLSFLPWVTNDDDARAEAEELTAEGGRGLDLAGPVELELGDSGPAQAVKDAVQTFPADAFGIPVHAETRQRRGQLSCLRISTVRSVGFDRNGAEVPVSPNPERP